MAPVDRSDDVRILAVILLIVLLGWGVRLLLVNLPSPECDVELLHACFLVD